MIQSPPKPSHWGWEFKSTKFEGINTSVHNSSSHFGFFDFLKVWHHFDLSSKYLPLSWSFYVMSFAHFSIQTFAFSVVICKYSFFINNIFYLFSLRMSILIATRYHIGQTKGHIGAVFNKKYLLQNFYSLQKLKKKDKIIAFRTRVSYNAD